MKNIIKFLIFIFYTISIFLINDYVILGIIFLFNLIIALFLKFDFRNMRDSLKIFLPVILFTVIINIIFASIQDGMLMGTRIFLCYITTYLYSKTVSILEIAETIEKLLYPLKIFKIDVNQIGMIISISLCMIPILRNEIVTTINAIKAKGQKLQINNLMLVLKPLLISILRKTNEMEKALIAKSYE